MRSRTEPYFRDSILATRYDFDTMKTSRVRTFCLLAASCLLTLVPFARAQHARADGVPQTYHGLVDQYFDSYFHFNPSAGTAAGLH